MLQNLAYPVLLPMGFESWILVLISNDTRNKILILEQNPSVITFSYGVQLLVLSSIPKLCAAALLSTAAAAAARPLLLLLLLTHQSHSSAAGRLLLALAAAAAAALLLSPNNLCCSAVSQASTAGLPGHSLLAHNNNSQPAAFGSLLQPTQASLYSRPPKGVTPGKSQFHNFEKERKNILPDCQFF